MSSTSSSISDHFSVSEMARLRGRLVSVTSEYFLREPQYIIDMENENTLRKMMRLFF